MKENYLTKNKAIALKQEMTALFKHQKAVFNYNTAALIVLDMQGFFANPDSHAYIPAIESIIPNIVSLIAYFEGINRPVIFTKHINTEANAGMMATWWSDIIKKDNIIKNFNTKNHHIIEKSQYDAFYNTELETLLRNLNVNNLIITGVMTHLCCETTARSAFVRGFNTLFVIDGTATYNENFHRASILNLSHGVSVPVLTQELIAQS